MRTRLCLSLILASAAAAQQTVAPTNAPVGSLRGEDTGNYNVTQSFELGYRWRLLGGDEGMYRSVENYRNGVSLLGSRLTVNSRDGHGRFFDEIVLTTQGLGNEPYRSAILRIQKNSLYRYDLAWRSQDYYNPALTVVGVNGINGTPALTLTNTPGLLATGGLHARDTSRRMQDHDLTLLPQSRFRLRLGYSRNMEDGPALSTAQEFSSAGAALPIYADVRREWNEYRLGGDVDVAGFTLSITRRWGFFKEDTPYGFIAAAASATGNDLSSLSQFRRSEPIHGRTPGWLGNLTTRRRLWAMNARATYLSGVRNFIQDEAAFGTDQFGGAANRQILVYGDASRPSVAGDLALSFFPTNKVTVVNNTSVLSNRIDGTTSYSEVSTSSDLAQTVTFRYIGIRTVANSTDVNYRVTKQVGFYGAYRYSDREVRYITAAQDPSVPGLGGADRYSVSNHLHSGVFGVRWRPWKPLSVNLDGEIGRAAFPLTSISEQRYHAINGRVEYRTRRLQLSTVYRQNYNLNGQLATLSFASHTRQYSANASWAPRDSFSLDASYVKLHLDTLGGIAFFAGTGLRSTLQTGYASYYVSNIHSANLSARFGIRGRADLYVGYAITKDTGDGSASAVGSSGDPIATMLASVRAFPLTYHSPMARVSIRITPKIRWNAGWQFYNYAEDIHFFGYNQNFRAHTGFTSVLWSF